MTATTPEGSIKEKVKKVLDKYKSSRIYWYMPVPNGYGKSTLDYLGFAASIGFAIETKRPRNDLTDRQQYIREDIERSGARVFRIRDEVELDVFEAWLKETLDVVG